LWIRVSFPRFAAQAIPTCRSGIRGWHWAAAPPVVTQRSPPHSFDPPATKSAMACPAILLHAAQTEFRDVASATGQVF